MKNAHLDAAAAEYLSGIKPSAGPIVAATFRPGRWARGLNQLKSWHHQSVARRHLNALSDRMLADIGIERFEIDAAVKRGTVKAAIGTPCKVATVPLELATATIHPLRRAA